jgi:hypothetical protein
MEVPCCFGLVKATEDAIKASGKKIPLKKVKVGIRGEIKNEEEKIEKLGVYDEARRARVY